MNTRVTNRVFLIEARVTDKYNFHSELAHTFLVWGLCGVVVSAEPCNRKVPGLRLTTITIQL